MFHKAQYFKFEFPISILIPLFLITTVSSAQDSDRRPVPMDWSGAVESAFDLSRFLEAPAGKDGHIRAEGENFIKPDGTRFRLWGINLCGIFIPKDSAPKISDELARCGFNCVRFHSIDQFHLGGLFSNPKNTREINLEVLDRFDFFVSELKKRGIYTAISINAFRIFREEDGVRDYDMLGFGKSVYYFDPVVRERFREFAKQILTHKNPYTGLEYKDEPALIWVELLNENSIVEAWANGGLIPKDTVGGSPIWKPVTSHYARELEQRWNVWLSEHVSLEKRKQWSESLGGKDDIVPISKPNEWSSKCTKEHFMTELRFFMELESGFYDEMKTLIKDEIGLKAMLTGDADNNDWVSPYPHMIAFNSKGDFIDSHGYWEHPEMGPPVKVRNNPMVNDPLDSTFVQFARSPMKGKPFTISETNTVFPHKYAGENFPILTAYSLFQDWDGIFFFEWGAGRFIKQGRTPTVFGISDDPVRFSGMILSGYMFHRSDLKIAEKEIVRTMEMEEALESLRWHRGEFRPFYTKGFSRSTPLEHKVSWQMGDSSTTGYPPAASLASIISDTKQLCWRGADQKKGMVAINSPGTQGVIGFVPENRVKLDNIGIRIENDYATVILTSLEDRPIASSSRFLLVAHSYYSSEGFEWEEDGMTVKNMGRIPMEFEPVRGEIVLKDFSNAKGIKVTPLTGMGTPAADAFDGIRQDGTLKIQIGKKSPSIWYLVEIQGD